jgi:hypothetical protein
MEESNCPVCGTSFPLTHKTRLTCSRKCTDKKNKNIKLKLDAIARKAIVGKPLYTKAQLFEAKHHIKLYDTPALARGREYLLIKAHMIVEYWRKRNDMEFQVERLRHHSRTTTAKWQRKKKNEQRRNNGDTQTQN